MSLDTLDLAQQDRLAAWAPLCMEPGDWKHWQRTNPRFGGGAGFAPRPCADCPLGFAAEMRAEGKCNGTPGWQPPADDYEEAQVGDTVTVSNVQISAPCGTCAHREVCSIRRTLGSLDEVDVTMPKPDPALTVVLGMTVECSHYLRVGKGKGSAAGRKLNLSDEERARRGERIQAAARARREAATA